MDKKMDWKAIVEKLKIKKEFSLGDTHLEVKLNKKYMDQGEK